MWQPAPVAAGILGYRPKRSGGVAEEATVEQTVSDDGASVFDEVRDILRSARRPADDDEDGPRRETAAARKTVLVVENDRWMRTLLSELLEEAGYEVVQASNGGEALRSLSAGTVDIVVLDLALPEVSGVDVLHAMKAKAGTRDIPVIIQSALANELAEKDRAMAVGVIVKPYEAKELVERVNQCLRVREGEVLRT